MVISAHCLRLYLKISQNVSHLLSRKFENCLKFKVNNNIYIFFSIEGVYIFNLNGSTYRIENVFGEVLPTPVEWKIKMYRKFDLC